MLKKHILTIRIFLFSFLVDLVRGIFFACFLYNLKSRGVPVQTVVAGYSILQFILSFLEPVSGLFADSKGRKFSTLLGISLYILGLFILSFDVTTLSVLISFSLAGIGQTLFQGARHAWLITSHRQFGQSELSNKSMFFGLDILRRTGLVLGAFIAESNPEIIWHVASIIGACGVLVGFSIGNVPIVKSKLDFSSAFKEFTPVNQNRVLWGILAMTAIYGIEAGNRDSITQIFVKDFLGNGEQFAMTYLQLGVAVSGIFGSLVYLNFLKDISPKIMICGSLITVGIVQYVCAFYVYNLELFYFLFSLQCFTLGWFYPLCDLLLYNSVKEKYKATALSMQNMADGFMQGLTCLVISKFLINDLEINKIWLVGSASAFICVLVLNIFLLPANSQIQEETK